LKTKCTHALNSRIIAYWSGTEVTSGWFYGRSRQNQDIWQPYCVYLYVYVSFCGCRCTYDVSPVQPPNLIDFALCCHHQHYNNYQRRRGYSFRRLLSVMSCLSVCLFIRTISQKPLQLGSPTVTQKCSIMSSGIPFILGRCHEAQKQCRRGFLQSCECWLLLVNEQQEVNSVTTVGVRLNRPTADPYLVGLVKTLPTPGASTYWLDGSSSTYRPYKPGEPNQYRACFVITSNGQLEDQPCLSTAKYICKITYGKVKSLSSSYHRPGIPAHGVHRSLLAITFPRRCRLP